jgi:hypothetical protein
MADAFPNLEALLTRPNFSLMFQVMAVTCSIPRILLPFGFSIICQKLKRLELAQHTEADCW